MFTIKEILGLTGGRLISGELLEKACGVSIDSRSIRPGEAFLAIKGNRFNGHRFIAQAQAKGAAVIIYSNQGYDRLALGPGRSGSAALIRVRDTVQALGVLAHHYRVRFKLPVIAITGSNGKTTTKEMLKAMLMRRFKVLYNRGTENNHIGVPLTIFRLRRDHQLVVMEIGANHPGEINWLSWIIQPTVGIITNIGSAHLEFFKSRTGVCKAKVELIKHLPRDGRLIINQDDPFLAQLNGAKLGKITFGIKRRSDYSGKIVEQTPKKSVILINNRQRLSLKAPGSHNVYNALAAVAGARNFGLSFKVIKQALASFKAPAMRMQMLHINNVQVINDCYNANPDSFRSALDFLKAYPNLGKKIVVCGDMLELGDSKEKLHLELGKLMAKNQTDFLITVGPLARRIAQGAQAQGMPKKIIRSFQDLNAARKCLNKITSPKDIVLIKASRAMQMENLYKCYTTCSTH